MKKHLKSITSPIKQGKTLCVCKHIKKKLTLYLKLNPDDIGQLPRQARDVRNIGHSGTGDFELVLKNMCDFEETKQFINEAFKNIGG